MIDISMRKVTIEGTPQEIREYENNTSKPELEDSGSFKANGGYEKWKHRAIEDMTYTEFGKYMIACKKVHTEKNYNATYQEIHPKFCPACNDETPTKMNWSHWAMMIAVAKHEEKMLFIR